MKFKSFEINCLSATQLVERKLSTGLSVWDRLRLVYHQRLCVYCKNYETQSKRIDQALRNSNEPIYKLPQPVKDKILKRITLQ